MAHSLKHTRKLTGYPIRNTQNNYTSLLQLYGMVHMWGGDGGIDPFRAIFQELGLLLFFFQTEMKGPFRAAWSPPPAVFS